MPTLSALRPVWSASLPILVGVLVWSGAVGAAQSVRGQQQEIPESIQEELDARNMSPAEARKRARQLGIDLSNPEQAARQARERGIPEARIQALLEAAREGEPTDSAGVAAQPLTQTQVAEEGAAPPDTTEPDPSSESEPSSEDGGGEGALDYFGYDTFENVPDAFKPSADGPVDDSYVVGPGDELRLVVWGAPEFQYDLTVDRQGRVYVPNHGQFTAASKQLSTLRADMKKWLSRKHSGLTEDPQTVFMDLSVTRIRPLRIFVLGEVARPGGYTVSAMSNAFNALYSVGGPLQRGSLRRVQVIREGEVAETVDLYDYLVDSGTPNPTGLQSGDYLRVPIRGKTVAITGAVERPAYYEMKGGETVRDLIEYAGGLQSEAYTADFEVSRLLPPDERDEETASVPRTDLNYDLDAVLAGDTTVELRDADRVRIKAVPERTDPAAASNVASASVNGAIFQPGRYALGDSIRTVRQLIRQANGLTGDAYREQATLIRFNEDLGEAVRSINVDSAMAGVPRANIPLVPGDSLHVSSVQNLEAERSVEISGQVRDPGTYRYRTNMTVQDLLLRGGGLADSTYLKTVLRSRADLYREAPDGRSERVIPFNLARALNGSGRADTPLRPGDEIRVYPLRAEVNPDKFVEISGAVKDTGRYEYQENLTVKDVILKANGFEEDVYLDMIEIARPREGADGMRTIEIPIGETLDDSEDVRYTADDTTRALEAAAEVPVQHRDRVLVRSDPEYSDRDFVSIQGEVRFPGDYALNEEGETLASVLERAGGVLDSGYPGGGQLVRDGEPFVTDIGNVVRGRNDLPLRAGDQITIPTTPNSVSVRGNVAQPGRIQYAKGRDVEYYLDRAGSTRDSTKAVYLTQATGATFKVDTGWFGRSPEVEDGAVIRVTRKSPPPEDQEGPDVGQIITDVTGILSSALTVVVLATRAFN
ncbi:SLBB domain-containing protein [Salinibacter ruber]|uniref:SLBB domain-containing protein n=1 Tax=Salinibacter ruber TaxID=146919 RepID=UPI0021692D15|nr:SLBB domain-containing protein [Salinibacter ruber]MCS3697413.1 protein involved in polysaccharide export with SLBB domain [Salinibacter ruber]